MKSYPFSKEGLQQIKIDKQKNKINNISNIIVYSVIAILLIKGTIGSKFLINMIACTGTSKIVKWLVR